MKDKRYLIIKHPLRVRNDCVMPQSSETRAEWHPYPQNIPLEIPFLAYARWNDVFPLSSVLFHLEFPNLGRSIGGERAEEEISVKKRRLFDCFKNAEGIRFRKFTALLPTMIHRAVLAPPFWRQKVAETNV